MRSTLAVVCVAFALCLGSIARSGNQPPASGGSKKPVAKGAAKEVEPLRFALPNNRPPFFAKVESTKADGTVHLVRHEGAGPPAQLQIDLTEGYYLGVIQEGFGAGLNGARLLRVQVVDVQEAGAADVQVSKAAVAKVKPGELIMLFRPTASTTMQIKQLPDFASLEEGESPGKKKDPALVAIGQSSNNLKQIGLALFNFHDAYNRFPPAVITGPDGKPWHSWRVLILPFIDEQKLYDQYKWDEPWDGPNNRKLLDKIPLAYADRVYGENKNYYTHYVAITGDGMAFSPEGVKFEANNLSAAIAGGRRIAEFTDGLSNTLFVGPAGPDRKIPWMKPEDIQIGDEVPAIGAKNGFPAPYKAERGNVAPFLRCDGSVTGLFEGLDKEVFRMMLTRHGGEVVDWDRVPQFNAPQSGQLAPVIYILRDEKGAILRDEKGASARLVMEPAPPGELELVPPPPAVERKPTRPVELKKAE